MDGLMFYDNSKEGLVEKVKLALACYENKRKLLEAIGDNMRKAEICLLNPKDVERIDLDEISKACGLVVRAYRAVLRNNLWIGYEDIQTKVNA